MSSPETPRVSVANPGHPPEDLDLLLRSFFRAEMPDPWPGFHPPSVIQLPPPRARRPAPSFRFGRRMALVASIMLLLATATVISRIMPDPAGVSPRGGQPHQWHESATRLHGGSATPERPATAPPRNGSAERPAGSK